MCSTCCSNFLFVASHFLDMFFHAADEALLHSSCHSKYIRRLVPLSYYDGTDLYLQETFKISIMNIHIREESFEVPRISIDLLLEGFIKMQGDLLTSPAVIFPCVDQNASRSERMGSREGNFSQQLSLYQVETRARAIIFDIAGYDASRTLCKRSSSRISQSADHPSGSLGREHSGLMSWPEQFFHPKLEDVEKQENDLSARAVQLSIFGSLIYVRRGPSFQEVGKYPRATRSQSCPTVTHPRPPLVSAKSEGSGYAGNKGMQESKVESHILQLEKLHQIETRGTRYDLSDDSGCKDEHIVRIDSPSSSVGVEFSKPELT